MKPNPPPVYPAPSREGLAAAQAAIPPRPEVLTRPNPTGKQLKAAQKKPGPQKLGPSKRATFTTRHLIIMYMELAGERTTDIALKLDMAPASVSAIKGSPLYQVHRAQLIEQLKGRQFDSLLDFIREDLVENAQFLVKVRKDELQETKDRLRAAGMMQKEADRIYPRQTSATKHVEERVVRITIGAEKLHRIAAALNELEASGEPIDVESLDPALVEEFEPPLIEASSIDKMRQELMDAATSTD